MVSSLFRAMPHLLQRSWRSSPDPEVDILVARQDGGIIAVEVTRLHAGGGEEARRWEEIRRGIVERAAKAYVARGLPDLEVVVFWSVWIDPTKQQRDQVAAELADFVVAHIPELGDALDFDAMDGSTTELPRGIDGVHLRRYGRGNHWHYAQSGLIADVSASEIRARLAAKDAKPQQYRGSYAERWLLLAVGAEGPSTRGNLPRSLADEQFTSSFDRVFLVRPPNEAIELALRRAV